MASTDMQAQSLPNGTGSQETPNEQLSEKAAPDGQPKSPEEQAEKLERDGDKQPKQPEQPKDAAKSDESKDKGPAGGFDATPIPKCDAGYTIKITFHRAQSLPIADLSTGASDPYVLAQLNTDTPTRHKEDSPLRFRTTTIHRTCNPEWNEEWIVANVPASGFKLKLRVYDEDSSDKDDLLGKVPITVSSLSEGWEGVKEEGRKVLFRAAGRRAYLLRAISTCFGISKEMHGHLFVSIEMLGRTKPDGQNGRLYTLGPCRWIRHQSPMLGRLTNIKEPDAPGSSSNGAGKQQKNVEHYNFQANQLQLQGPVPAKMYHRYVEFRPFVRRMFTKSGLGGMILGGALHHQHTRVYNFATSTRWGHFPQGPSKEMTQQFLDLVHYDEGGRIFTYVLTLDALWRFTETGKEFGIDMLSKHTMHSDVSIYIAFSGEFFIRRLKHPHRPQPPEAVEDSTYDHPPKHEPNQTHPGDDVEGGPPDDPPPTDPSYYELVIDNDSGTYRPNAALLPLLKEFMARSLPGLHIQVLDCQHDEEKMTRMKNEQRERKKKEGDHVVYTQGSRNSSVSSSDEEDLDRIQAGLSPTATHDGSAAREPGIARQTAKDAKRHQQEKWQRLKREYMLGGKDEDEAAVAADQDLPGTRPEAGSGPSTTTPAAASTTPDAAATTPAAASTSSAAAATSS